MSKGSKRRPAQIDAATEDANWRRTFGVQPPREAGREWVEIEPGHYRSGNDHLFFAEGRGRIPRRCPMPQAEIDAALWWE